MSEHLPRLLSEAASEVIADWEYVSMEDVILGVTQPCIQFKSRWPPFPDSAKCVPGTFLGGFPELPNDLEWPSHGKKLIPFVAQINLTAIPPLPNHPLPETGVLFFFCWATSEIRDDPCAVIWNDVNVSNLGRRTVPEADILADWQGIGLYEQVLTTSITHGATISEQVLEEAAVQAGCISQEDVNSQVHLFGDFAEMFCSDVEHIVNREWRESFCWGRSLGYADDYFSLGMKPSPAGYRDGDDIWLNLLRVSSVGSMEWSDGGELVFIIRADDLERRNFDSTRAMILSS